MKLPVKELIFASLAMGSVSASANCVMELQYQGTVLGQNVFASNVCRDAMRDCKRAEKQYEMNHNLTELQCVRVGTMPVPPTTPGGGSDDGGYNPPGGGSGDYNPPVPPQDPHYTRLHAMNELEAMENDRMQASQNYDIIMAYVDERLISLKDGVVIFGDLMQANGGSPSTTATRGAFNYVMEETRNGIEPYMLVSSYAKMAMLENDSDQAMQNLKIVIDNARFNQVEVVSAMNVFTEMLEASGSGNTTSVRTAFMRLVTIKLVPIEQAARDYKEIRSLENTDDDAMENYNLVFQAVREARVPYREAFSTMVQLSQRHGSGSTATAQSKFRQIFRI